MTDPHPDPTHDRPPTLQELDRLRLDPAPVLSIIDAGRQVRRRRRTTIASVAAVSVLLVGGGLVSTQVLGDDGRNSPSGSLTADGAPPTSAVSASDLAQDPDLDVAVDRLDPTVDAMPSRGTAHWDAEQQAVVYVSAGYYDSCLARGTATGSGASVRLVLEPAPPVRGGGCLTIGLVVVATVRGLTEAPTDLVVTDDGTTRSVPVVDAVAPDLTVTVQRLDGDPLEPGEARWDPERRTVSFVPDTTYDACLTDGAATSTGTTLDLALTEPEDDRCFEPALSALVTVDGLTEAPVDLVVTVDAVSEIVPVDDPAASSASLPEAIGLCPDERGSLTLDDRAEPPSWATLDYALRPYPGAVLGPRGPRQALATVADDARPLRVLDLRRTSADSWYVSAEVTCTS